MGFSTCPICTEELREGIVSTKCGHIFHLTCVTQWLKNKRVCPTCRTHTTKTGLIKLFLDSCDESFTISQSISSECSEKEFEKCKRLNHQLNKKIKELNDSMNNMKMSEEVRNASYEAVIKSKGCQDRVISDLRSTCTNLRTKMKYMVADTDKNKDMQAKLKLYERDIKTLGGFKVILDGSHEEFEELMRNTSDIETMARFIAGLKRDYASLQKSKTLAQRQSEEFERKLSFSRMKEQTLQMEIDELKRDKHQAEQDLSVAERKNDVLQRKIGEFDDRSLNNTNLMNGSVARRSLDLQTPIQLGKRQRTHQSTPNLFDDSFSEMTREFEAELSRDDDLDRLAAELGVDINMATTPGKPELKSKKFKEDNLFSKEGFDGLGGTTRIRKPLRPTNSTVARSNNTASASSLARSTTIGNFFKNQR